MSELEAIIDRINRECELPESWNAFKTAGMPPAIEVSGYDGETMQEEIVELLPGDLVNEVVIGHSNMPGRASIPKIDEIEEPVLDVPEQVGVLQFENLDDAIAAVDELSDPETLEEITNLRSPLETNDPLSVPEAVAQVTDIDMTTVHETFTSI